MAIDVNGKSYETDEEGYLVNLAEWNEDIGKVLAVGPGPRDEDGKRIAMDVNVGDRVLYAKYSGTEVKIDGKKMLILRESDILAIVEG